MHRFQRESFVIQVRSASEDCDNQVPPHQASTSSSVSSRLKAMKLFNRFRKILMRIIFSLPSHGSSGSTSSSSSSTASKQRNCERFDPPKTSCSSHYSSQLHYSEAIADCIEFLNKSSQEGSILDGRKSSDVWV